MLTLVLLGLSAAAGASLAQDAACGAPDAPCTVAGGTYHVALPEAAAPLPAVIWLHGYGRSGAAMIQKPEYVAPFTRRGYAVIMPSGQPFAPDSALDWGVTDGYDWARDDIAFIAAVRDDALARFGLDPARILIAGFSRGGSMVWDLACRAPELGRGFAAVAGAFWEPMPARCEAPAHLFHTHGFGDRLVPFEGREVRFQDFDFTQGNVMKGIDVWRRTNGCMVSARNSFGEDGSMQKDWKACGAGSIRLRLNRGGHGVPAGWRAAVLDWFEALP
ncbi:alpha/beta hydrolase family esterase [Halovulum marinum]|nr:PHB depolymerase family esterase [Halovulum marinum]